MRCVQYERFGDESVLQVREVPEPQPADGEPGLRPDYHTGYFAAFLRDPEGNRVEAVFHHGDREA